VQKRHQRRTALKATSGHSIRPHLATSSTSSRNTSPATRDRCGSHSNRASLRRKPGISPNPPDSKSGSFRGRSPSVRKAQALAVSDPNPDDGQLMPHIERPAQLRRSSSAGELGSILRRSASKQSSPRPSMALLEGQGPLNPIYGEETLLERNATKSLEEQFLGANLNRQSFTPLLLPLSASRSQSASVRRSHSARDLAPMAADTQE